MRGDSSDVADAAHGAPGAPVGSPGSSKSPEAGGPSAEGSSRLPVVALTLVSVLLVTVLWIPGTVSAGLFAGLAVAFPVGLIVLGARRRGRLDRRLGGALLLLLTLLEASVAGILLLSGPAPGATGGASLFGFPAATVIQVAGLWLLPLPLVALAYALTFDRSGITRDSLDALRRRTGNAPARGHDR